MRVSWRLSSPEHVAAWSPGGTVSSLLQCPMKRVYVIKRQKGCGEGNEVRTPEKRLGATDMAVAAQAGTMAPRRCAGAYSLWLSLPRENNNNKKERKFNSQYIRYDVISVNTNYV